jgi:hypothetical protein
MRFQYLRRPEEEGKDDEASDEESILENHERLTSCGSPARAIRSA